MELFFIGVAIVLLGILVKRISNSLVTLKTILSILTLIGISQNLSAGEHNEHRFGLIPATQEMVDEVDRNWPQVIGVRPNALGLKRLKHVNQGLEAIQSASGADEFITIIGNKKTKKFDGFANAALPSRVDNSTLPSFPPIGSQNGGACVAWATTYYLYTHEYGLLNGLNNKKTNTNIFSPKWTYNLLNNGRDGGLFLFPTFNLYSQNGLVTYPSFPPDDNATEWDLRPADWKKAISARAMPAQWVAGLGGTTQNLQVIKQMLVNGHILNFATLGILGFVLGTVGKDPSAPTNPYAGQVAVLWQGNGGGGHALTIVGYDDNVWIDINGNGVVDPGEKGAFKVVNSWGPTYANEGFIWIAYDAFLTTSAVVNGPNTDRVPVASGSYNKAISAVPLKAHYAPKLIGEFTLKQTTRDQISVAAGVSGTDVTAPAKTFVNYALKNQGGNLEFNGTAPGAVESATFYVDFTDLLPAQSGLAQRYYLTVQDNTAGNPTTVAGFRIIDLVNNVTTVCKQTPVVCDNSTSQVHVDYTFNAKAAVANE